MSLLERKGVSQHHDHNLYTQCLLFGGYFCVLCYNNYATLCYSLCVADCQSSDILDQLAWIIPVSIVGGILVLGVLLLIVAKCILMAIVRNSNILRTCMNCVGE